MTVAPLPDTLRHRVSIHRQAFSTPFRRGEGTVHGCLYDREGCKIARSERSGGHGGDLFVSVNPPNVAPDGALPCLTGRSIYLGSYMNHYGHFITETLSTFWYLEAQNVETFDHFVFHSFVFGDRVSDWAAFLLSCFGIRLEAMCILSDRCHRFEEIHVPERLLRLNLSADPALRPVYRKIVAHALADGDGTETPTRIYLSRRHHNRKARRRLIANEAAVEQTFAEHGFATIYPEQTPIGKQIRAYASADAIAGPSGSGLHNVLFTRPGAALIELADPRYAGKPAPTQEICNGLAQASAVFIPAGGRCVGKDMVLVLDRTTVGRCLTEAGFPYVGAPPKSIAARVVGILETAALVLRALLRDLFGRSG